MIDRVEVGPLIRELRHRLGCTPEKLAVKLGVSLQTINRWETGLASACPSSLARQRIEQTLHELGRPGEDLLAKYFFNGH